MEVILWDTLPCPHNGWDPWEKARWESGEEGRVPWGATHEDGLLWSDWSVWGEGTKCV